jgi:general secretion pathway protein G
MNGLMGGNYRNRSSFFSSGRKGFSLVELMIVIAILGLLIGLGIREYVHMSLDAKLKRARRDLKTISSAIQQYNTTEKREFYKVRNLKSLQGRYLEQLPKDPWGNPYKVDGTFVYTTGPDGKVSGDDIKRRYERESIVRNPSFQTRWNTQTGGTLPTGWTFNPQSLRLGETTNRNFVDLAGEEGTPTSAGNALKIQ